jgi:imidazolonepropionase-like amidohydrolase
MPETENRYSLAAELSKAGAEVSILPVSDDEASFADLWDDLRTQVANGWPKEDALKSVTLNPAKLLGLDEQLGTMQKERAADILFLDADPFAPGARVREVMIGGEMVIPRKRGH